MACWRQKELNGISIVMEEGGADYDQQPFSWSGVMWLVAADGGR